MTKNLDIRTLLERGHAARSVVKAIKEAAVKGHPRIGSAGAVSADGKVYGTCHRKAFARSLGIEEEVGLHTRIMWAAGESNEDVWTDVLTAAGGLTILRHDEAGIRHKLDGVNLEVLGHPDIVLADADGKPALGLELKGVFGYTTANSVYFEGRPKNDNLIQSAAYSHFLGVPYVLCYTSASYIPVPFYDKKYGVKTLEPFYKMFYLEWRDGTLHYRDEAKDEWVQTAITQKGIEDYYRLVAEMPTAKDLGPRITSHYVNGDNHKWGAKSDCKYCPFAKACDQYDGDKDYDAWIANIQP